MHEKRIRVPREMLIDVIASARRKLIRIEKSIKALAGNGSPAGGVTKQDLLDMEDRIMSALSEYANRVKGFVDKVQNGIEAIASDIAGLEAKIKELQNSPGAVTPEDQALLDALEAQITAVADRVTAVDNLTPPTAPPA